MTATSDAYRLLPKVDALLAAPEFAALLERFGRAPLTEAIRADVEGLRERIKAGDANGLAGQVTASACAGRVSAALERATRPAYVRALNATGVILHTGLGRAPLPPAAQERLADLARSFAVLEIERDTGKRGRRDDGITAIVRELTGAEAACVVNNNAGATLIALAALAKDRPVIVSRGQLVEIGGSYRIPDVMEQSGARLVEVGATNRTHLRDYERALDQHPDTALLLRVHTSNFQVMGFTKEVPVEELVGLGSARGVEVMDDLGSGCLIDLAPFGLPREPVVQESLAHGAGVVTFSGDKLLGGPQAGIIVGKRELVTRIRKHPLYRALRPDKLTLGALEASLGLYRDMERVTETVPALRMISARPDALAARAKSMAEALTAIEGLDADTEPSISRVGAGSYAVAELATTVVNLRPAHLSVDALAQRLREGTPSVFTRVQDGALKIDPRTLLGPGEDAEVFEAVRRALA